MAGVPGVDLAWSANGYVYHTRLDTAERAPPGALQRTGDNVLALVQGTSPLRPASSRFFLNSSTENIRRSCIKCREPVAPRPLTGVPPAAVLESGRLGAPEAEAAEGAEGAPVFFDVLGLGVVLLGPRAAAAAALALLAAAAAALQLHAAAARDQRQYHACPY